MVRSTIAALLLAALTAPVHAHDVHLYVAASMADAAQAVVDRFGVLRPEVSIQVRHGASGDLARRIEDGSEAHVFVSASQDWAEYLIERRLAAADGMRVLARNQLVFVGLPREPLARLEDIVRLDRIAIGSPRSVPAGRYAHEALRAAGVVDSLTARVVLADDVRKALDLADSGSVDGAFVYRTDALRARAATVLYAVPDSLYSPPVYPAVLTAKGTRSVGARAFFVFLGSDEARAVIVEHGFLVD